MRVRRIHRNAIAGVVGREVPSIKYVLGSIARKSFSLTAAGLAYFFLMALIPALVLLSSLSSYLSLRHGVEDALDFLSYVLPEQSESTIGDIVKVIGARSAGTVESLSLGEPLLQLRVLSLGLLYDRKIANRHGLRVAVGVASASPHETLTLPGAGKRLRLVAVPTVLICSCGTAQIPAREGSTAETHYTCRLCCARIQRQRNVELMLRKRERHPISIATNQGTL